LKNSGRLRSLAAIVSLVLLAGPALAQSDAAAFDAHMSKVRKKVIQKRDSALNTLLEMNAEQDKAFWPLQRAYDKELNKLGKKDRALLREFSDVFDKLTAETARDISTRFFDLGRQRLELQQKYLEQISEEVSPVVAVQFIQLQRRFETELAMERMKYSPIAE